MHERDRAENQNTIKKSGCNQVVKVQPNMNLQEHSQVEVIARLFKSLVLYVYLYKYMNIYI